MTVDAFLAELEGVRKSNRGWLARCPAHEDSSPSLSIAEGDDGRVLVRCFAGCTADKITAALGLKIADLFPGDRDRFAPPWRPSTPAERQAIETRRLRRQVAALELEQRRWTLALGRAAAVIALAFHDDAAGVLTRLWRGAVDELEREAAAAADAEGVRAA